jgi:hypothetical protein
MFYQVASPLRQEVGAAWSWRSVASFCADASAASGSRAPGSRRRFLLHASCARQGQTVDDWRLGGGPTRSVRASSPATLTAAGDATRAALPDLKVHGTADATGGRSGLPWHRAPSYLCRRRRWRGGRCWPPYPGLPLVRCRPRVERPCGLRHVKGVLTKRSRPSASSSVSGVGK